MCISQFLLRRQAFTTIAIFNAMRFCLALLPQTVKTMAEAAVSIRRLKVTTRRGGFPHDLMLGLSFSGSDHRVFDSFRKS